MAETVYALSVRQPYAHLILSGVKLYEARTWQPANLGPVLIHASQSLAAGWFTDPVLMAALNGLGMTEEDVYDLPRGALLGRAVIDHIVPPHDEAHEHISIADRYFCSSDGYTNDLYLWRMKRPAFFKTPAIIKGRLNLWPVPSQVVNKLR